MSVANERGMGPDDKTPPDGQRNAMRVIEAAMEELGAQLDDCERRAEELAASVPPAPEPVPSEP